VPRRSRCHHFTLRAAEREPGARVLAETCRRQAVGSDGYTDFFCGRLRRAHGPTGGELLIARSDRRVGKPAVPQGRGEERSRIRERAGGTRGSLRQRCFLQLPPGPCLNRGGDALSAELCWPIDDGGDRGTALGP